MALKFTRVLILLLALSGCAITAPEIDTALLQQATEGNAVAQYEMGMRYWRASRSGWNINKEYAAEAEQWFEKAADQGDPRAQYELSRYYFGRDDRGESLRLTHMAAVQNLAEAQYSLGMHYGQAWGTEQNLVLAYKWIALGNEGGVVGGSLADTDWLVWKAKMTPDQVAEGQRLAAEHTKLYGKSQRAHTMASMPDKMLSP